MHKEVKSSVGALKRTICLWWEKRKDAVTTCRVMPFFMCWERKVLCVVSSEPLQLMLGCDARQHMHVSPSCSQPPLFLDIGTELVGSHGSSFGRPAPLRGAYSTKAEPNENTHIQILPANICPDSRYKQHSYVRAKTNRLPFFKVFSCASWTYGERRSIENMNCNRQSACGYIYIADETSAFIHSLSVFLFFFFPPQTDPLRNCKDTKETKLMLLLCRNRVWPRGN